VTGASPPTRAPGTVHVRVPTALRPYTGGLPGLDVDLAVLGDLPTVAALLDSLAATHPDLERRVRDERGRLRRHVNLFLGPENVRDLDEQATRLAPGAELAIIPAVSGGQTDAQAWPARSRSSAVTALPSAWPFVAFMTWPTKKPVSLPRALSSPVT
jgi:sulfur-carrier protein